MFICAGLHKNVLGLPKSGGQARLSDLETLGLARCSHVESLSSVDHPSTLDQLEVRKAGVVHPLFLRGRNTFYAKRDGLIPWGGFAGCVVVTVDGLGNRS